MDRLVGHVDIRVSMNILPHKVLGGRGLRWRGEELRENLQIDKQPAGFHVGNMQSYC